jgi:hypothetical protein
MRELLFEAFFALVECRGHTVLVTAIAKNRVHMQFYCRLAYRPRPVKGNIGALFYGENTEWKTWAVRDCAAPTDRLG